MTFPVKLQKAILRRQNFFIDIGPKVNIFGCLYKSSFATSKLYTRKKGGGNVFPLNHDSQFLMPAKSKKCHVV